MFDFSFVTVQWQGLIMAALATGCLIVGLVAWSAVLTARGLTRRARPAATPPAAEDWAVPYKIESDSISALQIPGLKPIPARTAALRALCLAAFVWRSQEERGAVAIQSGGASSWSRDTAWINRWLRHEELWPLLADIERRGLETPAGQWDDSLVLYAEGAREALTVLAWAGQFCETIPSFDARADAAALCASVGLLRPTGPLLLDLSMRPEHELTAARELCQAWLWRARVALDHLDSEGGTIPRAVIRSAARYWSAAGVFSMLEDDFPVGGLPFAKLNANACRRIHRVAQLRLHGLNWVCGLAHDWNHVSSRRLPM